MRGRCFTLRTGERDHLHLLLRMIVVRSHQKRLGLTYGVGRHDGDTGQCGRKSGISGLLRFDRLQDLFGMVRFDNDQCRTAPNHIANNAV